MQIKRTVPILLQPDADVLATVRRFQAVQQAVSAFAFECLSRPAGAEPRIEPAGAEHPAGPAGAEHATRPAGAEHPAQTTGAGDTRRDAPPSAYALQSACYGAVAGQVSSQMTISAIRLVAGACSAAWRNGHAVRGPSAFRRPLAVWLIGDHARDASVTMDEAPAADETLPEGGTLSLWTPAGRKRLRFRVPPPFRRQLARAVRINSVTVLADSSLLGDTADGGGVHLPTGTGGGERVARPAGSLRAWLTVTVHAPDPAGHSPVGVDRGAVNALVAVDADDRVLFLSGREHQAWNERTRQVRQRVRRKKEAHEAQGKDTRSTRRLLQRLSRKQRNRTRTFAQQAARALCAWAPAGAVLVLEDLRLPAHQPVRRDQARGRLTGWFHGLLRRCIETRAETLGVPVVTVHPAFTSLTCSRCGGRGRRSGLRFACPHCGHAAHADINAACVIRDVGGNV